MKSIKKAKERTAEDDRQLRKNVEEIIDRVQREGDAALKQYNEKFDQCRRPVLRVSREEIEEAYSRLSGDEIADLRAARENIEKLRGTERYRCRTEGLFPAAGNLSGTQDHTGFVLLLLCPGRRLSAVFYSSDADYAGKSGRRRRIAACSPVVKGTDRIHDKTLVAMDWPEPRKSTPWAELRL